VVLVIGANLGWYSLLLGRRFPKAHTRSSQSR
jgi:hypothetical protein